MNPNGGIFSKRFKKLKVAFDSLEAVFNYPEVVFPLFPFRVSGLKKVNSHANDAKRVVDFVSNLANPGPEVLKLPDKVT
jgi:hypothetical protein